MASTSFSHKMPILVWRRLCLFHSSSSSHFQLVPAKPIRIFFSLFSSSPTKTKTKTTLSYLANSFKLTETQALSICNRFSASLVSSPEKLQSVHSFLREYGFLDTHIHSAVRVSPQILFLDVTSESHLRELVSRVLHMGFSVNSRMLVHALYTVSCLSSQTFRKEKN